MAAQLLEREAELAALDAVLDAAAAGRGAFLVVEGAAGIGKTSLLAAAGERAGGRGVRTLAARGAPLEQAYGFGTVRRLFEPAHTASDPAAWARLTADAAGLALPALDPAAGTAAPGDDAIHATLHGLFWLAANLAADRPLALLVDDAHWVDPPSLRWLGYLARRIDGLPLVLVAAVRTGEPPSDARLLDELVAEAHDGAVRPRPLGAAAAARVVRARVPDAGPDFCAAAHAVTGGNPFHLHALVTAAAAEGLPPVAELAEFGPESVARGIARQLARLPAGAVELARAVAVLGGDATLREAAALAGLDPAEAARVSDGLRTAGLLAPGPRLDFAHPIQRAAVAATLGPAERALWHGRAAQLLRTAGAEPERVGLQLLQAEPGGDPRAVEVLRVAARAASARGAPESATAYLRRALAEPPDAAARPHVQLELGLALAVGRHPDAPALLHEAVAGLPAGPGRGEAGLRAARALALAALFTDVVALCRATLAQPAGIAPDTIARLEAEFDGMAMTRAGTLREVRERPPRKSPVNPLSRITAAALGSFAGCPAPETVAQLRPVLAEDVLAAERESLVATVVLSLVLLWNDELEAAGDVADGLLAAARPRGWASAVANGGFLRAAVLLRRGEIAEAEADARDSFDFKRVHSPPDSVAWALVPLVDILRERDDLDGAEQALRAGSQEALTPDLLVFPLVREARARLRLAQGRPREALADARAAAASWAELGVEGPGMIAWRLCAAEALMALGEGEEAAALAAEQLRLAERLGAAGPCAAALRTVARCGPRADAPETLARAVERLEGSAAGLERMHARCDLGAALRRSGHREAAREPLRRALALADRGGALRLAARAQAELRFAGARPRRAALAGRDALTPAERRVAALAAEGRTNRQIAQALFVTQRTVETHLTHAFAKLGVGSRDGLPAALWPAESRERAVLAS